jgi:hypothetical protein
MPISLPRSRSRHPLSTRPVQAKTADAPIRRIGRALLTAIVLVGFGSANADAQTTRQPLRVQLHVAAEETLKSSALGYLAAALRPATDVVITDRDADYVLSVMILPTTEGGYAISTVVMNVYSERRLADLSARWELTPDVRERLLAVFKGAGALLDQRVRTGPSLQALCDDIARGVDADVFAIERRVRNQP